MEYRTGLNQFVLDQIDFIEGKINEAIADPSSQKGAITEAGGIIPQLKERLWSEDKDRAGLCMYAFPELVDRDGIDLLPQLPSFIRRVCSSFAPDWGVLRTRWV